MKASIDEKREAHEHRNRRAAALHTLISAATAELLDIVAEVDEEQSFFCDGSAGLADWLATDDYAWTPDPGGDENLDGFDGLTLAAWIKPDVLDSPWDSRFIASKDATAVFVTCATPFLLTGWL